MLRILKGPKTWVMTGIILLILFLFCLFSLCFATNKPEDMKIIELIVSSAIGTTLLSTGILGITISLKIFVDEQKEGIEILVVSKPITRNQIIWGRLIFLLMFDFVFSLLVFLDYTIAIHIAKINQTKFGLGAVLFGMFMGTFLLFLLSGLVASAIGTKFSGKLARVLPMIILFCSFGIETVQNIIRNYTHKPICIEQKTYDDFNDYVSKNRKQLDFSNNFKISIKNIEYDQKQTKQPYSSIKNGDIYIPLFSLPTTFININNFTYESKNRIENYNLWIENNDEYRWFDIEGLFVLEDEFNNCLESTKNVWSPAVVFNYLNPISAIYSIIGLANTNDNVDKIEAIPVNKSYKRSVTILADRNNSIGLYLRLGESKQIAPFWAVGSLWLIISGVSAGLIIFLYMRKDFI